MLCTFWKAYHGKYSSLGKHEVYLSGSVTMATYLEFIAPYFERASFPLSEALKSKAKVLSSFQSHCVMSNYCLENLDIQKWLSNQLSIGIFQFWSAPVLIFFLLLPKPHMVIVEWGEIAISKYNSSLTLFPKGNCFLFFFFFLFASFSCSWSF